MKKGFFSVSTFLLLTVTLLLTAACVRPTPRPENVQITEVPILDPLPVTPTTEIMITVVATVDGGAPVEGTPVEGATDTPDTGEGGEGNVTTPVTWPQSHEVIAGDTISRISIIYNVPIEEIVAANGLTNPDDLELGQVLTIPEPGTTDITAVETPVETPVPTGTEESATQERVHIVQAGDTLFRISVNFGTTVDALAAYNGITNINALEVGQEIRIPPSE